MPDDTIAPFGFPAVGRKKVTAAFDGGRITSDGGVMLLAAAERRLGVADRLAALIADPRNPLLVTHSVGDILRARILAIACGYEDADDLDRLRTDPGFKLACGRLPDSGRDLCSQPTMSRWENAPDLREVIALSYAMIDLYCASYARPPEAVTLDVDDTVDVVHGHQQLALFNAHYDERCFLPIHTTSVQRTGTRLTDGSTGRPIPDSGSDVNFDNGGCQVSYDRVPAIEQSRTGDQVRICLVSVPPDSPRGDNRGYTYQTTNLRTRQSWTLPNAEHMCGGA